MKRLLIAAIVSVILNAAAFVVNLVSWQSSQRLPLALRMHGGEVTVELGFGLRGLHTYAMRAGQATAHSLRFEPVSMVVCLLIGIGIVYLLLFLGGKVLKK